MKGIVEHRVNQHAPFQAEMMICLEQDGQVLSKAKATNLSAGGIEFEIAAGGFQLGVGDTIEFYFDLPLLGRTTLEGEIRHNRLALDDENKPVTVYGVKFIHLPLETWNFIVDYCQRPEIPAAPEIPVEGESIGMEPDNQSAGQTDQLVAELQLRDGSSITSRVVSINIGGLTFLTEEPLPDNTRLTIRLATPTHLVYLPGVSVWCNPTDDGFQIGINFVHINQEESEQLQIIMNQFNEDSSAGHSAG